MTMPTDFTPVSALAGGALIGAAMLVPFLTLGRIAGVSGMIGATFRWGVGGAALLLGLIAGPLIAAALLGRPLVERSSASAALLVVAGLAVGAGIALAGMTNPSTALNFLDVTRGWDSSLAFVMAAAIPVSALAFWIGRRRAQPAA